MRNHAQRAGGRGQAELRKVLIGEAGLAATNAAGERKRGGGDKRLGGRHPPWGGSMTLL